MLLEVSAGRLASDGRATLSAASIKLVHGDGSDTDNSICSARWLRMQGAAGAHFCQRLAPIMAKLRQLAERSPPHLDCPLP